jgi:biopolymer transport protein ExbD
VFARKKKRSVAEPVKADLPITPMLDMSFQLLTFFVFTFRPTPMEGQLSLFLPKEAGNATSMEAPPITDEVSEEFTIEVRSTNLGDIASIKMKTPAGETNLGADPKNLQSELKKIARPAGQKPPKIKIESANELKYARIIEIMDLCIRAGFDQVGVVPIPGAAQPPG